jgi:putative SOS response-associated peptidase YedK
LRKAFDIPDFAARLREEFVTAARVDALSAEAVADGDQWMALYDYNLQEGVAGFGDSPEEAYRDFDPVWYEKLAFPTKRRSARANEQDIMCERFQASSSPAELVRWFETTGPAPNLQRRYNAAPGQHLPIVLRGPETGKRRLVALRWGLIPAWAKDAEIGYSTINAMAETVATEPAFRDAFACRRCLVPADGFYGWKQLDADGKTKQPYRFIMADGSPMAFAGLWEQWNDPANGETVRTFAIITGKPNALCAPTHNRMPVILDAADWQTWLGEVAASSDELQALLQPYPAERMKAHMIERGSVT